VQSKALLSVSSARRDQQRLKTSRVSRIETLCAVFRRRHIPAGKLRDAHFTREFLWFSAACSSRALFAARWHARCFISRRREEVFIVMNLSEVALGEFSLLPFRRIARAIPQQPASPGRLLLFFSSHVSRASRVKVISAAPRRLVTATFAPQTLDRESKTRLS
jgi:hypothetical protein